MVYQGAVMFADKSIRSGLCLSGYGVLILMILTGSMTGCSSTPDADQLYSSEAGEKESISDNKAASLLPAKSSSPSPSTAKAIPVASYSPMDRAVVLQYVEKGESDTANLSQALKLVQRAEQLSHAERTMEDYLVLAAHNRFKGDMQKVVQHANQGIMAKSDNKRVKAHMFIYLGYTYEKKSTTMAGSYFKQAVQIDPELYKGHYELGRISFEKKKYPAAKIALKKAFELSPKNAEVYGMLGQMFYALDLYEEAVESLKKALELRPQTHWIHLKLGDTYFYGLRKREEAESYYQQAVLKNDSDPDAHFGAALYYRYKSDYERASNHLQKAMTLDARNPKYKKELEDMLSEKDEMAQAIQKYKQAIAENPTDPDPVAQLGGYYLRWRKHDKAEAQYKKAVELASSVPDAPVAKPDSDDQESDDLESDTSDEPVVEEPSKMPEYANSLGWFYFNDKKYAQAEQAFKKALKVNPKHTPAQFGLGRTYETLQQYKLAASHYTKAAALDPDNQEAQKRLDVLKESGKLMPVGEMVKTQEGESSENPVMEVKK
jgi:tetratricopeptide (TPR) repeat protein